MREVISCKDKNVYENESMRIRDNNVGMYNEYTEDSRAIQIRR